MFRKSRPNNFPMSSCFNSASNRKCQWARHAVRLLSNSIGWQLNMRTFVRMGSIGYTVFLSNYVGLANATEVGASTLALFLSLSLSIYLPRCSTFLWLKKQKTDVWSQCEFNIFSVASFRKMAFFKPPGEHACTHTQFLETKSFCRPLLPPFEAVFSLSLPSFFLPLDIIYLFLSLLPRAALNCFLLMNSTGIVPLFRMSCLIVTPEDLFRFVSLVRLFIAFYCFVFLRT